MAINQIVVKLHKINDFRLAEIEMQLTKFQLSSIWIQNLIKLREILSTTGNEKLSNILDNLLSEKL